MRKAVLVTLIAGATALGALAGCAGRSDPPDSSESPVVPVRARAVEARMFTDVVTAQGQWRSSGELVVAAPFAGAVESLELRPGDQVRKGAVLCRLLTRESRAALQGAALLAREAHDDAGRAEAARALDIARHDLVSVPVVAPRAGMVLRISARGGSEVAESAEILALLPAGSIVFEAHVNASEAPRVRPGLRASVVEPGVPPRSASVERILPVSSGADQATLVWLTPDSVDPPPQIDRFGSALIVTGAPRTAVAVPDSALVQDDLTGETRVAVIDAERRAIWTRVTPGAGADGWHELISPLLPAGTMVITDGQRGLPDSTRVKPAP